MNFTVKLLVSVGGLGYTPLVPGTMGSLAGLAIAWFVNPLMLPLCLFLNLLGLLLCKPAVTVYGQGDPQQFVLDETAAMLIVFMGIPQNSLLFVIGFTLFRIFDSWKPWPIILLQRSKSPYSIMWDDMAAAILVNLILQILIRAYPKFFF